MSYDLRSNRVKVGAAILLTAMAIILVGRSLTFTPWYQERLYKGMALEGLAKVVRQQPEDTLALYYYGKALNQQGRYAEALHPLERAVGLDPDSARLRGEWSLAQLAGGYITGAFGQLTQFIKTHPDSAEGHLLLGRFYVAQDSYIRATEELDEAVALDPRLGEAWSMLAGARTQMGGLVLARDAARKAVELRPNSAVDRILLASLFVSTDSPKEARQEFEKAIELAPTEPDYLVGYARYLLKSGESADSALAEKTARQAIALNPGLTDAQFVLGKALAVQGKTAEAIEPLKIAASAFPPNAPRSTLPENAQEQFLAPAPALELARAYRKLGNTAEAKSWEAMYTRRLKQTEEERQLSDAVRNSPDRPEVRRAMALFLARRGDVEGVARNFAKVKSSVTDAPLVLVETANALSAAGYGDLAVPLTRRAIIFSKNSPAAFEAAGNALLAIDQPHEAAVKYAKAAGWWSEKIPIYKAKLAAYHEKRRQKPTEAEQLYQQVLARERARIGLSFNVDEIKSLLIRVIAMDPKNTDYRRHLLKTLISRNEPEEAEKVARELLQLSPDDGLAHAMLAILLLEKQDAGHDLSDVDAHLKVAEEEEGVLQIVHYAQGLLALRRNQPEEAVRLLRQSASEEPADRTYYQLAKALRLTGKTAEADQIMATFTARVDRNKDAINLMKRISEKPEDRQRYTDAVQFFMRHGMAAQAATVDAEMRHRFHQRNL